MVSPYSPPTGPYQLNRDCQAAQGLEMWFPVVGRPNVTPVHSGSAERAWLADSISGATVKPVPDLGVNALFGDGAGLQERHGS